MFTPEPEMRAVAVVYRDPLEGLSAITPPLPALPSIKVKDLQFVWGHLSAARFQVLVNR
jgi:hypothetical protein